MDVYTAATSRRAIRRFKATPVPYEALERCVDAGRLAPSAKNRQLCEYIIVEDEALLPRVYDSIKTWAGRASKEGGIPAQSRPRAYILVLVNATLEAELGGGKRSTGYDVGLAAENIILVGLEQGLGACPVLSFDEALLEESLNIPDDREVALVLAMGYPDESPVVETAETSIQYWVDDSGIRHVPKRRLKDVLHRNGF